MRREKGERQLVYIWDSKMAGQWKGGEEESERKKREKKKEKEGQMTKADADEMHWLFWVSRVSTGRV